MLRSFLLAALVLLAHPAAAIDVAQTLAAEARALVGAHQGVYVETEAGKVLVSQAASKAVHPASVSKVPTTLALLEQLGPGYRFATRVLAGGPLQDGTVVGHLVVEADGDPSFVDENALLVALALKEQGVRRVRGDLVLRGPLVFDWQADQVASRLQRVLAGNVREEVWDAVREARGNEAAQPPLLVFEGLLAASSGAPDRLLLVHYSQALVPLMKALNGYSNNVFHPFAERIGGVKVVEKIARESVPAAMRDEIILTNGAGAGATNRLSPRAAVALLRALAGALAQHHLALPDVLPVSGIDDGTLHGRLDDADERGRVVGKTGTYGDYGASALAGAIRTNTEGVVYFAILNHDVPVPEARERQNAFISALLRALPGEPWPYQRDPAPAFTRATVATK
jgi:D-alanyl-D-alanine carboxypeptidase/D-alanyl-D-alanine-endopeptidase (penicillin-binding protein 4)